MSLAIQPSPPTIHLCLVDTNRSFLDPFIPVFEEVLEMMALSKASTLPMQSLIAFESLVLPLTKDSLALMVEQSKQSLHHEMRSIPQTLFATQFDHLTTYLDIHTVSKVSCFTKPRYKGISQDLMDAQKKSMEDYIRIKLGECDPLPLIDAINLEDVEIWKTKTAQFYLQNNLPPASKSSTHPRL